MNLSTLIGSGANPYLEFGWVTAPNAAGQSVTANTITTLTIDTEIADTGSFGSIASNQITLAAGTYYYDALTASRQSAGLSGNVTLGLYNITAAKYVSVAPTAITHAATPYQQVSYLRGQFTVAASSVFDLRMLATLAMTVDNGASAAAFSTLATAGADQRTTLKLWKLA